MGDIKSAREIALEKIEKIGEATEEERLKWKYGPKGEELAASYLKDNINLNAEFDKHPGNARRFLVEGAQEVFVRNINLPTSDAAKRSTKRAIEGLKLIKNDKVALENVFSKIRNVFDHYTGQGQQQKEQAYDQLKVDFEAKIRQAVQQQLGTMGTAKIDVERQPQFQQEWHRVQNQKPPLCIEPPISGAVLRENPVPRSRILPVW